MIKLNKYLSFILASVFLIFTFSGCGKEDGVSINTDSYSAPSSTHSNNTQSNVSSNQSVSDPIIVDDKINSYVELNDGVSLEMLDPRFWLKDGSSKVLMTYDEIKKYNCNNIYMFKYENQKGFSLNNISSEISRGTLLNMINHKKPEKIESYFLNGSPTDEAFWDDLIANVDAQNIPETVKVQYGYSVKRSSLRLFPSELFLGGTADEKYTDEIVSSEYYPYLPLCVVHESADKEWYFVLLYGMAGWVKKDCVALCKTKKDWQARQNPNEFLTVTGDEIRLTEYVDTPLTSNLLLPMGTKLPLVKKDDKPSTVDGRSTYANYVVKIPTRGEDGYIVDKYELIPVVSDVCIGAMPYTRENVIRQSFKLIGDRYGWAGMFNSNDCSGIVHQIFSCFGFVLPRTAAAQQSFSDLYRESLNGLGVDEKKAVLDNTPAGTLLYMSGHIMIYLGKHNNNYYCISSTGGFTDSESDKNENVKAVAVNSLNVKKKNGQTWLELTKALQYMTPKKDV